MIYQDTLSLDTPGRSFTDLSSELRRVVKTASVRAGTCHIFVPHTSCAVIFCENMDPDVRDDLEQFMANLAPDSDQAYRHSAEGPDDMPAHIRSIMTHNDLTVPIMNSELKLGVWQGVFLWEHRTQPHQRDIYITIMGE